MEGPGCGPYLVPLPRCPSPSTLPPPTFPALLPSLCLSVSFSLSLSLPLSMSLSCQHLGTIKWFLRRRGEPALPRVMVGNPSWK